MDKEPCKKIQDDIFKKYAKDIKVFLRSSKTKSANHDPYRNTGYTKTLNNNLFIKAMTKNVSPNSLIIKEMGLTETGAMELIVKDDKIPFIVLSEKIFIGDNEYYVYNDAVGSKLQIFSLPFGYSKVIIFRKDK